MSNVVTIISGTRGTAGAGAVNPKRKKTDLDSKKQKKRRRVSR